MGVCKFRFMELIDRKPKVHFHVTTLGQARTVKITTV